MQQGPQMSPFRGVSAWTPKVQVTHINKYFWRKQLWSTEGFHSWPCKYEHRVRLTDYAKGEKSELLPQSVHVFLERCFGSLEILENSWFSLLGMWSEKMMFSPERLTPTVLGIITVVPTAAWYTLELSDPKPPTGSAGHRASCQERLSASMRSR